ncbi:MAG: amino acid ABC transporter substrate-binding protein [Chitinophagales bacterium]
MKNRLQFTFLFIFFLIQESHLNAQSDSVKRHRIAVFVPLYLDSAFDAAGNYRYDKNFPKFINPGLEFYEGAELAIDSLQLEKVPLDIHIYDTRSTTQPMQKVLQSEDFQQTELIIGHVVPIELHELAAAASKLKVPFINVNFPNDGGITNNPDFVILNSTLKTHCEGIYKFFQRNYGTSTIYVFTRKGQQEDRLKNYFLEIEKNTASVPLKMKFVMLNEPVAVEQLISHLDSSKRTICLVGSLDENFGKDICAKLASVNKLYITKIFGMPTWDNITDFSDPVYADQEIYYTTPFYINQSDSLVQSILQYFKNKFYSRPSDMVFRGYETIYRFGKLLRQYGKNLGGSIGEKKYKVFSDFDIEPVFLNKQNMTLDYFENRKLYFIKKVNGNVVAVY